MNASFVHETAVIDPGVELAPGVRVWHFSHVSEGAVVGPGTSLGQNVFVGRGVRLGARVKVQNNVSLYEGVEVDDEVFLGPSCVFTNVLNPRAFIERKSEYRRTFVGRGVTIGANATIVCGHDIGEYAFIGAGATVTRGVPAYALVVGTPARRTGWMCRCGTKLPDGSHAGCVACGAQYVLDGERCMPDDDLAPRPRVSERARTSISDALRPTPSLPPPANDIAPRGTLRPQPFIPTGDPVPPRPSLRPTASVRPPEPVAAKVSVPPHGKRAPGAVPFFDLTMQHAPLVPALTSAFERVLVSNHFIMGTEVEQLEAELCEKFNYPHAIAVSSGTDALLLALMALGIGPGDEVITTPFSFFATAGAIARVGARPVFVDIDPVTFNLDASRVHQAVSARTKAILPVHLFGQPADLDVLATVAARHKLSIIEDAAQALGASHQGKPIGTFGQFGCFSFFPSKNLGGFGDGGLVVTKDPQLAERARMLRAHGAQPRYHHTLIGGNFRLDALQAALLRVKLPELGRYTDLRRAHAHFYDQRFAALAPALTAPRCVEVGHVYNQYVVRSSQRDALRQALTDAQIGSEIYYPRCLHEQPCFAALGHRSGDFPEAERAAQESLALPIFPELREEQRNAVARAVLAFVSTQSE
ncbi:MAG TPA: aminotransferase class I/II-fold pyridoxal phosphate-dependent enzyme [Polyangiales bacterium]|nr:aminotransferase class I/II-fold pyridoxal phosphate-dependent enzyme [Polyangiales bacterium]